MALLSLGRVKSAAMQTINGSTLPIAIDFGTSALKVLQMSTDDTPQLVAAAALDTPDSIILDDAKRFQFQCQALPRLIKAGNFRGKRALCAIPAGHMLIKHMQFPKSEGTALDELVRSGVPQALGVAPEALVLRHFAVDGARTPGSGGSNSGGGGVKQEVICLAAARELVDRMMTAVRSARLEVVGIHPECIATARAFDHLSRRAGDEHLATLLLDLGARTTKVWILHGKQVVFAKVIRLGGLDLDTHVSRVLDLTLSRARSRRLEASVMIAPAVTLRGDPNAAAAPSADAKAEASVGGDKPARDEPTTATAEDRRAGRVAAGLTPPVQAQQEAEAAPAEFDLNMLLETLTDEVAMCLRYHEGMFPGRRVDRAAFFGGEARHRGLCQLIARRVRTPVHVADPVARIARTGREPCLSVDFTTPQPGWTVPFGLSLCPTDL